MSGEIDDQLDIEEINDPEIKALSPISDDESLLSEDVNSVSNSK